MKEFTHPSTHLCSSLGSNLQLEQIKQGSPHLCSPSKCQRSNANHQIGHSPLLSWRLFSSFNNRICAKTQPWQISVTIESALDYLDTTLTLVISGPHGSYQRSCCLTLHVPTILHHKKPRGTLIPSPSLQNTCRMDG